MTYRFDTGVLVLTSDAAATLEEWKAAAKEAVASPDFRLGMSLVHDARLMARVPSASEVRQRISFVASLVERHSVPRWAVILAPGVQYGMGRMGEAYAELSATTQFRAFKSFEDAFAWALRGAEVEAPSGQSLSD